MDRFTTFAAESWPRWMENEIARAQFVIVIATEKYAERFAGKAPADTGLGATWEGAIITQDLYEATRSLVHGLLSAFIRIQELFRQIEHACDIFRAIVEVQRKAQRAAADREPDIIGDEMIV